MPPRPPARHADKRRVEVELLPDCDRWAFIFSYAPNRTSEYDICLIKDALNPAYKLRRPDFETEERITEAADGRFDPGSTCNVCIRLDRVSGNAGQV